ncbi:MAG: hypothetical protein ACFCBW_16465 [Candidatus Competibacterales bacterium]
MGILKHKYFWIMFPIMAFVAVLFSLMPKPIGMNLEEIGSGQKAVVFIYDPNLLVSNQQATEMNKARELVGEQALFLIAKIGDPRNEGFKRRYQVRSADLLFFDEEGRLIDRQIALLDAEELARKLSNK